MQTLELVKKEESKVDPKEYGLEEKKANEMISGLNITIEERQILEDAYIDVIDLEVTEENLPTFKELRLKIVKNRTQGIEKWHKTNKAFYLAGGRFVDAIKNKESLVNEQMESKLLEAEKHFENLEKERITQLQKERSILLYEYVADAHERELSSMDEDVWNAYLSTKKQTYLDEQEVKAEAERQRIEAERIEAERIEAQRVENERLKKEAEEREKEIEKERLEARKKEQLRLQQEQKEREERQRKEAIEKAKQDAVLLKEREEKAKLEAELQAKEDAETKAKIEAENKRLAEKKEAEKRAKAPVKKQLNIWVDGFNIELPNSELLNNDKALIIKTKFDAFKKWAKSEIESL